ncbi:hypothetical protein [Thiomicrorhabdus sp.]|uniref:hypothetical protein n=1 Tax=Thiomicrorhabdus sp. TaxID=2039724 RepID=UPI0029C902B6|nr:hypothetical protein [Thiomicrorhabdus sp.]
MKPLTNRLNIALIAGLLTVSFQAKADNNIDTINLVTQEQFKDFSENLTGIFGHRTTLPAEPLGVLGFDIGVSATRAQTNYKLSNQNKQKDDLYLYSIHATKGLPYGMDIGIEYTQLDDSDASSLTGELRYALVEGGALYPAISLSANYTQTSGMDAIDYHGAGVDLGISKGFANLTPFASVGMVYSNVDPKNTATLKDEDVSLTKFSAGANLNLMVMDLSVSANRIGDQNSYSLKAGFRF